MKTELKQTIKTIIHRFLLYGTVSIMVICLIEHCYSNTIKKRINKSKEAKQSEVVTDTIIEVVDPLYELRILFDALSYIESSNNPRAKGSKGEIGIIQIRRIYIDEINRLVGYERYVHNEAYCPKLSWMMFMDYNNLKNPDLCIIKAIILHNPRASKKYREAVKEKFNELINKQ